MCQCTLFDAGGVEIHSIECIEYCTKDQSIKEMSKMLKIHYTYVTAVGLQAGNTWFTFVLARVGSNRCMRQVIMATRSSVMVMNTIFTLMGGHALASPKGGGPCSLGTFNYGVASHLAFRLT